MVLIQCHLENESGTHALTFKIIGKVVVIYIVRHRVHIMKHKRSSEALTFIVLELLEGGGAVKEVLHTIRVHRGAAVSHDHHSEVLNPNREYFKRLFPLKFK